MLKRFSKSIIPASLAMVVLSLILFSFSNKMGTDSYEVYINKKLVFQQYVGRTESLKSLQLDQGNYNDEIEVYYNHCGRIGTGRTISIRDAQDKVLKEWHFQDTPDARSTMDCRIKDIVSLQKLSGGSTLHLYYSSRELPAGKLLAALVVSNAIKTAKTAR